MATRKGPTRKKGGKKKAARGGRRGRNTNVITVDFTDVEAGGGMPTPDGFYVAEILSAEQEISQAGNDMITVRWKTQTGSTVFDRFVLLPQSLWVLRTALDCMGFETPDGPFDLDVDALVGERCGLEIINEEYDEKDQPRVTGYLTERRKLPKRKQLRKRLERLCAPALVLSLKMRKATRFRVSSKASRTIWQSLLMTKKVSGKFRSMS